MFIYTALAKENFLGLFVFMGSRVDDLEDSVKEQAAELVARLGSQKQVLSAGILALYDLCDKKRGDYMMKAVGKDIKPANDASSSDDNVYDEILKLADQWKVVNKNLHGFLEANLPKTKHRRKTV